MLWTRVIAVAVTMKVVDGVTSELLHTRPDEGF